MLDAPQLQAGVTRFRLRVTNIDTGKDYDTISVRDLLTCERTFVAKDQAALTLCSTYNKHDARSHKAQEQHGRFVMHAIDLDTGNLQGAAVVSAVQSFTGEVMMRVYSSSSATASARKWRVIIPTATEMPHDEWHSVSVAINRHIEQVTGFRPDRALEGAGQGNYMPNTAPRDDGLDPLIADKLIEAPLFNWRECAGSDAVLQVMAEEDERRQEYEQRAAEARKRIAQMRARPDSDKSVIEQFNAANDLEQVLTACGYKRGPRGGWRSPQQSTDSFATKVFDEPAGQYWVSKSASDFAADVGSHARDGGSCFGDAFDVWCFYTHSNDRTAAIKSAADQLGIKPPPSQVDQLADLGRRNNTMKALQTLAGGSVHTAPDSAGEDAQPAVKTEFDEPEQPAAANLLRFVRASQLPDWQPPRELIEGVIIERRMSVVYGDSNTGKSFLVLDMAAHLSLGLDWFGKRVRRGGVLYLAAEAPRSIMDRSRALAEKLGQPLNDLFITDCPIDIYDPNGDTAAIVATVQAIEQTYDIEIVLIVVDTLARAMGGGDENATKDMGVLVQHSDLIRDNTRAHVMFVHHTGKDASKGARGSSALRAATDTEIEVSDPGNQAPKQFKVTKQRDLEGKGEVYGFILTSVRLGMGVFDNVVTTCYVQQAEPAQADPESQLTPKQSMVLDLIRDNPVGGMRYGAIVKAAQPLHISEDTVRRALASMVKMRVIFQQSGQYRVGPGVASGGEF